MSLIPGRNVAARVFAALVMFAVAMPALATNGYFLIGYGTKSRAMGGVGVALGLDSLSAAANPAAYSDLDMDTMRIDIAGDLFIPKRAVRHDAAILGGQYDDISGSNLFLIPAMGGVYKFNRKLTIGMAAIGNGANTRYNQSVPECEDGDPNTVGSAFFNYNCNGSATVGVNLIQMQMLPTVAYRINKQHSVGASLAIAIQTFRAYGLQSFGAPGSPLNFTSDRENLTNRGNDYSYGAGFRLGWLGHFFDRKLSIGLNYASRVYMSKFKKYSGLFAEQGDFDIPEHYAVGIAVRPVEKLTLAVDVQHIRYSTIRSVANPGPDQKDPSNFFPTGFGCEDGGPPLDQQSCALGRDKGMGFGWKDQVVVKVGGQYEYNDKWTFRGGYNYGTAQIPEDQILFSLLAPAVTQHHITVGLGYRQSRNIEWNLSYGLALKNTLRGKTVFYPQGVNNFDELDQPNAAASMYIHAIGFSFSYLM